MNLDGKNKKALCKKTFRIGSALNFAEFIEGNWYDYRIEVHEETKIEIYYISPRRQYVTTSYTDTQPMIKGTFKSNFCDLQQVREDKLNQILKD
jgi:hypothetical protein